MFGGIAPGKPERMCSTDGLWQVTGDRRGLRRNHQRSATQHLVAATAGGIISRTRKRQQHVAHHILTLDLICAGNLECSVAVVQERDIIGAQGMRDSRHPFVAAGADGVKPLPLFLHDPAL